MKLSAPTQIAFFISLILVVVSVLAGFGIIGAAAGYTTYLAWAGWAVIAAGCVLKGF